MHEEPKAKAIEVLMKFAQGSWQPANGIWPQVRDGAQASLIIPMAELLESAQSRAAVTRQPTQILPAHAQLAVAMRPIHLPRQPTPPVLTYVRTPKSPAQCCSIITLLQPLALAAPDARRARLESARCWIPALEREAASVNEAYSLLSQHFEPDRRSHTANVFHSVYFVSKGDGKPETWLPLEVLRARMESSVPAGIRK
jgi:hypothetical protein